MKSPLGAVLASLFFIFSVIIFIYAVTCHNGMYCGLVALIPAMPWVLLPLSSFLPNGWGNSFITLIIFALLNVTIIYYLGALLSRLISKKKLK